MESLEALNQALDLSKGQHYLLVMIESLYQHSQLD